MELTPDATDESDPKSPSQQDDSSSDSNDRKRRRSSEVSTAEHPPKESRRKSSHQSPTSHNISTPEESTKHAVEEQSAEGGAADESSHVMPTILSSFPVCTTTTSDPIEAAVTFEFRVRQNFRDISAQDVKQFLSWLATVAPNAREYETHVYTLYPVFWNAIARTFKGLSDAGVLVSRQSDDTSELFMSALAALGRLTRIMIRIQAREVDEEQQRRDSGIPASVVESHLDHSTFLKTLPHLLHQINELALETPTAAVVVQAQNVAVDFFNDSPALKMLVKSSHLGLQEKVTAGRIADFVTSFLYLMAELLVALARSQQDSELYKDACTEMVALLRPLDNALFPLTSAKQHDFNRSNVLKQMIDIVWKFTASLAKFGPSPLDHNNNTLIQLLDSQNGAMPQQELLEQVLLDSCGSKTWRLLVAPVWLVMRAVSGLPSDDSTVRTASMELLVETLAMTKTIKPKDTSEEVSSSIARLLHHRQFLSSTYQLSTPTQIVISADPIAAFLTANQHFKPEDIDCIFSLMCSTPSTIVRQHILEMLKRGMKYHFNSATVMRVIMNVQRMSITQIPPDCLDLIRFGLSQTVASNTRLRPNRIAIRVTIVRALAKLMPEADALVKTSDTEAIKTKLRSDFEEATGPTLKVQDRTTIIHDQISRLAGADAESQAAAYILPIILDSAGSDFKDRSWPHDLCQQALSALERFCKASDHNDCNPAHLENHLICAILAHGFYDGDKFEVKITSQDIWACLTDPAMTIQSTLQGAMRWSRLAEQDEKYASSWVDCIDKCIAELPDDADGIFCILALDYLLKNLAFRRNIILVKLATKMARIVVRTKHGEIRTVMRARLINLATNIAESQQDVTLPDQIQKAMCEVLLEDGLDGNVVALHFITELLGESIRIRAMDDEAQALKAFQERKRLVRVRQGEPSLTLHIMVWERNTMPVEEIWIVPNRATLSDFFGEIAGTPGGSYKIYIQGVEVIEQASAGRRLAVICGTEQRKEVIIARSDADSGQHLPNDDVKSPRTVVEGLIIDKFDKLWDLVYEPDERVQQAAAVLIETVHVPEPDSPTQIRTFRESFVPGLPINEWKIRVFISAIHKNLSQMRVPSSDFIGKVLETLYGIVAESYMDDSTVRDALLGFVCEAISRCLAEIPDTLEMGSSDIMGFLWSRVRYLADKPQRPGPECYLIIHGLLDVAALTPDNLERLFLNSTIQRDLTDLLCNSKVCDAVAHALSLFCISRYDRNRDKSARAMSYSASRLDRVTQAKAMIWNTLSITISGLMSDGRFSDSHLPVFLAAETCLRKMSHLVLDGTNVNAVVGVLFLALRLATLEPLTHNSISQAVTSICSMLIALGHYMKSEKKPFGLPDRVRINLQGVLFEQGPASQGTPDTYTILHDTKDRSAVYKTATSLCSDRTMATPMLHMVKAVLDDYQPLLGAVSESQDRSVRSSGTISGLVNLNQTCYLNSTLQQLFMNIDFRRFILSVPVEDETKQKVLSKFHHVFHTLDTTCRTKCNPVELVNALNINIWIQEDAQLFFTTLLSTLEDDMPNQESKDKLYSFYRGRNRTQTVGECNHVSDNDETIVSLPLTVKGKSNLLESLEEYVRGEQLDDSDRIDCTRCKEEGRTVTKVTANRRTRLEHVPDNLVIGLKRIEFIRDHGATKINDRFDFPPNIDLAPYKIHPDTKVMEGLPPDVFELTGIIVHKGITDFGHYWSYVKDHRTFGQDPGNWYGVEDAVVRTVELAEVLHETCGAPRMTLAGVEEPRSDNAYMLFYRRKAIAADPELIASTAERIKVSEKILSAQEADNKRALLEAKLFDPACRTFIQDLMAVNTDADDGEPDQNFERTALELATRHLLKVLLRQRDVEAVEGMCDAITKIVDEDTDLAHVVLDTIFIEDHFDCWIFSSNSNAAAKVNALVLQMLGIFREGDPEMYGLAQSSPDQDGENMITHILRLFRGRVDALASYKYGWVVFFGFLQDFARSGPIEARYVAESDFFDVTLDFLYSGRYHEHPNVKYPQIGYERHHEPCYNAIIAFQIYALTNLFNFRSRRRRGMESDEWNALVPQRLYCTDAQHRLLGMTVRGERGLALVTATIHMCPFDMTLDPSAWGPSKLCRLLCLHTADGHVRRQVVDTLANQIFGETSYGEFRGYLAPIICLIRCTLVPEESKLILVDAVLSEPDEDERIIAESLSFIVNNMHRLSKKAGPYITNYLGKLILTPSAEAMQLRGLRFLRKYAFQPPPLVDDGSLGTGLSTVEILIPFLATLYNDTKRATAAEPDLDYWYPLAALSEGLETLERYHHGELTAMENAIRLRRGLTQMSGRPSGFDGTMQEISGLWNAFRHLRKNVLQLNDWAWTNGVLPRGRRGLRNESSSSELEDYYGEDEDDVDELSEFGDEQSVEPQRVRRDSLEDDEEEASTSSSRTDIDVVDDSDHGDDIP